MSNNNIKNKANPNLKPKLTPREINAAPIKTKKTNILKPQIIDAFINSVLSGVFKIDKITQISAILNDK